MPKMKTSKSAKKRFRFTATGKVKREKAFASHIMTHKSPKQKRRLRKVVVVHKSNERSIRRLLPYGD